MADGHPPSENGDQAGSQLFRYYIVFNCKFNVFLGIVRFITHGSLLPEYLKWFYSTMNSPDYTSKIKVGGVWPGFDDLLAFWRDKNRFISRQNGKVYENENTMALAQQNNAPIILLETWNDFEEGTDIEFGVNMTVDMEDTDPAYPKLLVRS